MNKTYLGDMYGLKPMSLKEEAEAPQNIRNTRNNKVRIINDCDAIMRTMESIRGRVYRCPELDEDGHAKLVEEFTSLVAEVKRKADEAFRFGYN